MMRAAFAWWMLLLFACGPTQRGGGEPDACEGSSCGGAVCVAGTVEPCYTGPAGTEGVGACKVGSRTCTTEGLWGACTGETVPRGEICANQIDDDCNTMTDEELDLDGDGFTTCQNDCCDNPNQGCQTPNLVNPGAFEVAGNTLDDDCDGQVDNAVVANCDMGLASNSATALDYAKAMDLCQTASGTDAKWGVVSATLVRADGTGAPSAVQHSIRTAFGGTAVQFGSSLAVLSTGSAAAVGQTQPGYINFQTGAGIGTTSGFPADYIASHGGTLPNAPGCPAPIGTSANDPVMLQLQIRAPTNARSFSFSMNFLSSEYPEWTCSPFNDFFVVLLDSAFAGSPPNPVDKNLAFYKNGANQVYPVGVNLAYGDTGLFQQCTNGPTGCASSSIAGNISTCIDTAGLVGTGMDQATPPVHGDAFGQPGYCGANNRLGGGTGWLTTSGNVVGGETITLRIALWDTSDGIYDSVALIDNFQWSVEASQPGTVIQ